MNIFLKRLALILSSLFLFLIQSCGGSDDNDLIENGSIKITLSYTISPVDKFPAENKNIVLLPINLEKQTDENGVVIFDNLPHGEYQIELKNGSSNEVINESIKITDNNTINITHNVSLLKGVKAPEITKEDIIISIDFLYSELKTNILGPNSYNIYWGDIATDIIHTPNFTSAYSVQNYDWLTNDTVISKFWENHYITIVNSLALINRLETKNFIQNITEKNNLLAELKFIRSLCYFNLVKVFNRPAILNEKDFSPNDISNITPLKNSTPEEIYDYIINDLKFAQKNLSLAKSKYKASIDASTFLLAKVYLQSTGFPLFKQKNYTLAFQELQKLKSSYTLMDEYSKVFNVQHKLSNSETIFAIENYNSGGTPSRLWHPQGIRDGNASRRIVRLQQNFSNSYLENGETFESLSDKRFYTNIATFSFKTSDGIEFTKTDNIPQHIWTPSKFTQASTKETGISVLGIDYPVFRYADVLLMIAEVENAMHGPTQTAYDAINSIRYRAFGDKLHDLPSNLNKDEFLNYVLNERKLELCFEGVRRDDLIRNEKLEEITINVNDNEPNNTRINYNFMSHKVFWPIPNDQIFTNQLSQNPGY